MKEENKHYQHLKRHIDRFCNANMIPFSEGCIIKYALRHDHKNGAEDLNKAIDFCERRLQDTDYPRIAHNRVWSGLMSRVMSWYQNEGNAHTGRLPHEWEVVRLIAQYLETRDRDAFHDAAWLCAQIRREKYEK